MWFSGSMGVGRIFSRGTLGGAVSGEICFFSRETKKKTFFAVILKIHRAFVPPSAPSNAHAWKYSKVCRSLTWQGYVQHFKHDISPRICAINLLHRTHPWCISESITVSLSWHWWQLSCHSRTQVVMKTDLAGWKDRALKELNDAPECGRVFRNLKSTGKLGIAYICRLLGH